MVEADRITGGNADFERIVGPVAARAPQQDGGG
jgi:hypothetical protein